MALNRITGSLWSVPNESIASEAERLAKAGLQTWHWDFSDGTLGPAGGFTSNQARKLTASTGLKAEAHLMFSDPRHEISKWVDFVELIIVHAECDYLDESINIIQSHGLCAGVAISLETDPHTLSLPNEVGILVMTVAPGHAGSSYRPDRVQLLENLSNHPLRGIDGSANKERALEAFNSTANWIVSGTALTSAENPRQWISQLEQAVGS